MVVGIILFTEENMNLFNRSRENFGIRNTSVNK